MRRIVSDEQRGPEPKSARPFGVASGSDQSDPDWSESALKAGFARGVACIACRFQLGFGLLDRLGLEPLGLGRRPLFVSQPLLFLPRLTRAGAPSSYGSSQVTGRSAADR